MVRQLTPGQCHDSPMFESLMEQGTVKRPERGRPKRNPGRVVADKAYGSSNNRAYLRFRGIRLTIPLQSNERRRGPFDRKIYKTRNIIERTINRLKQYLCCATRYEKNAVNFLAQVTIASILLWL